tara:strand:- start:534 stop:965 length:432 start_codon:yes stop_codon:yes gene_type:complete
MWKQMLRFGIVGALATFVHMVNGYLLIQAAWNPLVANLLAFAIAFLVSFIGHLEYSFADQDLSPSSALRRFAVVALIGFGFNEGLLVVLLSLSVASDTMALWISTGVAAILIFLLSRMWAFRAPRQAGSNAIPIRPDADLNNP